MALISVLIFLAIAVFGLGARFITGRICPWFYLGLIISPLWVPIILLTSGSTPYGAIGGGIWSLLPSIGGYI